MIINYYISDTHFGWTNKYEGRTLNHDQLLKESWNKTVTNADTVYILGDIGKIGKNSDTEKLIEIIATLKGKKILIVGNHDNLKDSRLKQLFIEICDYKEVVDMIDGKAIKLVLSHYPILMWNGQHKGTIHLYGHVHATDEWDVYKKSLKYLNEYFKDKTLKGYTDCPEAKAYNVGCMVWEYKPITLKEILQIDVE